MHFASFSEFLDMGGYGFFVWLAFGISFASLFGLYYLGRWQDKLVRKRVITELARIERIQAARKAKQKKKSTQGELKNESEA